MAQPQEQHSFKKAEIFVRPAVGIKFISGWGAETRYKQSKQKWGSGDLPVRIFVATPISLEENAPVVKNFDKAFFSLKM